ncbi:hypothetical protein [Marmoricola sp. RAF53]|uniref:hypothetical protein n=1 Tax=Marmoricola sp. RAF53 TaxID=3233059 RepID=UPI003F999D0A
MRRILRGVFVSAHIPDSPELRARAIALVRPGPVIACDRTAAWLHGIDVHTWAEQEVLPPVEVCVLRGTDPTERSGVRSHSRDLAPEDVVDIDGLLVTSPLRTALDLGCNLFRPDALAALDQFRNRFDLPAERLHQESIRFFRRRGVIQLRELIGLSDPRSESVRESWTRLALMDAGLPVPEVQWWVEIDGVPTYRLDLAYPHHRVAIEYDGAEFHTGEVDRERDALRREFLRELGWTFIVVGRGDFSGQRRHDWIAEVRKALSDRPYANLRW